MRTYEALRPAAGQSRHRRSAAPAGTPLERHVLGLQRQAGNATVAASIRALQRRKVRSHLEVESGLDVLGADALEAILLGRARDERLGDLPGSARDAGEKLLRCLHGRTAEGAPLPVEEQLALYAGAAAPLNRLLDRALAMSGGDLPAANRARRALLDLHTALVADRARGAAAEAGRAAELLSPRVKVERLQLAQVARKALDFYVTGQEFLDKVDTTPGLSKELRAARITTLKGVIALCDADSWPSYEKLRGEVDAQLARTDPDRMLGAGAAVIDQLKKAAEFTTASLSLVGTAMKAALMGRGMLDAASRVGDALGGLEKLSGALAVLDVLHGAMVLLDDRATGSQKAEGMLEILSGGIAVTEAAATAVGAESVAAVAGRASPWAMAVTVNYKAYKALAEYAYSSVVGGLSTVEVTNELEGDPIFTKRGMFRPGGLDDLGTAVTEARLRVESLQVQLESAGPGEGEGVRRALEGELARLKRAIHAMYRQWSIAPLDTIKAYMPAIDMGMTNALSEGAEPWMVLDEARRWEDALATAFARKDEIVEATMHATMRAR